MQHDGIEPNLQCFNAVIHGLGLAGEWKRAEAIMEVIHKTGLVPDEYSYNSMAMAYASVRTSKKSVISCRVITRLSCCIMSCRVV